MQTRTIADSIARWSLVLLAGLTPLFIIPAGWAGVGQAKVLLAAALITVALVAWLAQRFMEGTLTIPRNLIVFASALLPLAYFASALASGAPAGSYANGSGGQDTVAAAAILFATLVLYACVFSGLAPATPAHAGQAGLPAQAGTRSALRPLCAFLVGSGAVIVFQVLRLFIPSWLSLNGAMAGSASSAFGGWHDLAELAALLVFLASVLWSSPAIVRGSRRGMIAGLILALGIFSFALLIVIDMPDVWYELAALMLLVALYQWWSARREGRVNTDALWRAAISITIGAAALLCGFGSSFIYNHLPKTLQIAQLEVRPSWQGTFAVGEKVFGGAGGLVFGSGPNTFPRAWGLYKPAGVNQTNFWNIDFESGVGLVPTSFVTSGILGALAWLLLLLALLWRAWRFLRNERNASARSLYTALVGGALLLAAYHILYTPGVAISIALFLFMGLMAAFGIGDRGEGRLILFPLDLNSWQGIARIASVVLVAAAILVAGASIARATVSDLLVGKSAFDYQRGGALAHSLALIQEALVVYPDNDVAHRASVELGILQMQQLIAAGDKTSVGDLQAALSRTIREGLKAVSINSGDYQNWLALAALYQNLGGAGVSGAYQNAIAAYQKAATANPTNPLPLIGQAQVAIAQNNASSSLDYLGAALLLKPNLAIAYFLRSQVEARNSSFTDAIQDAKNAVSLAQQDPLGWYNLGVIFYASGDYQSATLALRQALTLNNNYANALFVLSFAFDKLGDHTDALAAMQQVVKLNPTDQTALQALANLEASKSAVPSPTAAPHKSVQ